MYALVMWIGDEPTTSVVLLKDVEFNGKKTRAKWGPNYWPVQILRQNADKDWLQSLSAIANGQVIWSRPKNDQNGPAPKKQKLNDEKKSSQISENKKKEKTQKVLVAESDKKNRNESKNSNDESEKKDNDKMKNKSVDENREIGSDDETVKMFSDEEMTKDDDSDYSNSSSEFDDSNDTPREKIPKSQLESVIEHCGLNSMLTPTVVNFFKDLAEELEKMFMAKEVFSRTKRLPEMSELIPGSGVLISKSDLLEIRNTCTRKPKEMTRRLIRSIIDKDELKNMSLTGRGSLQAIPKNIFNAVETFVRENSDPNLQLTRAEYSQCLTQVCSNLRNTRLSADESAKMKSNPLTEQYRRRLRSSSSNKRDEDTSKKSESSTERPKLAARKRPTVSCEATCACKRIVQRK